MIRATLRRSIVLAIVLSMAATAVSTVAATAQTGDVDVTVRARGATGTEQMQVRLGNSVVAEFTASTNWEEIDLEIDGPASFDDLSVGFINNQHDPVDRNVFVDWVTLDGERREADSPDVWSTGKWTSETGCTNGPASNNAMLCSGFLYFGGQPDGSTVTAFAVGATGTENLELQIDGTSVATRRVTSAGDVFSSQTPTTPVEFLLPEAVDHGRLRIAFTNDGRIDGDDRNVLIDRIQVDSTSYATADPRIETLGSVRNGADCGQGFFENEVLACNGWFQLPSGTTTSEPSPDIPPVDSAATDLPVVDSLPLDVEVVASAITNPWGMAFLPSGELMFAERLGRLNLVTDSGVFQVDADFTNLGSGTSGLLGLAIDSDFESTRRFYTCQGQDSPGRQQVIAWELSADQSSATRQEVLVDVGRSNAHSGCRLATDEQGYLWATFGDDFIASTPQDPGSLHGKVLRIDPQTGAGHPDNGSDLVDLDERIYSLGHRNPQGLAFHPETGAAWISEHGPDRDDEINRLIVGGNYGWDPVGPEGPTVYDELGRTMTDLSIPGAVSAQWRSGVPTVAPGDIAFLDGGQWGDFEGALAMTTLKDKRLHLFLFDANGQIVEQAVPSELDNSEFGRLRSAVLGPDGALYVSTSNSGFGDDDRRADEILRITSTNDETPEPPDNVDPDTPPTGDNRAITITARGTTGTERLQLDIDGVEVHSWNPGTVDGVETYLHDSSVSGSQVRVRFTNDGRHNGADRNVLIDNITIGNQLFESEHPTVLSRGSWTNGSMCREGTFNTEFLACNGWFQYADDGGVAIQGPPVAPPTTEPPTTEPPTTQPPQVEPPNTDPTSETTITFRALGTTGEERVELRLGDERIATFELTTTMRTYSHQHVGPLDDNIRIAFINDRSSPQDRNVRIDYLRIDDVTFQAEDPDVFSTGTFRSDTRCAGGNKRSEWLHCNGFLEFETS